MKRASHDELERLVADFDMDGWIEEAVTEGDYVTALARAGRNRGPKLLSRWWESGLLSVDDLRGLILDVWESAEWPRRAIGERRWLAMFKATGFVSDGPPAPVGSVTVFRGAPGHSGGRGMSWSFDHDKARWFADRWTDYLKVPATVFEATVPPRVVLAFVGFDRDSRGEREAVLNPNMLRGRIVPIGER